jgi:hypothetical protein
MRDDSVYLRHILECISRIERHVSGGREAFFASDLLQDATLRNLQTYSRQRSACPRLRRPHSRKSPGRTLPRSATCSCITTSS